MMYLNELNDKHEWCDVFMSIGEGWYPIVDEMLTEIERYCDENDLKYPQNVCVLEIKEKFGQLRVYLSYQNVESYEILDIEEIVDKYESKSITMCEQCGKEGKLRGERGVYVTLCDEHFEKWKGVVVIEPY